MLQLDIGSKSARDLCVQDMARVLKVLLQREPDKPQMAQVRERLAKKRQKTFEDKSLVRLSFAYLAGARPAESVRLTKGLVK